MMKYLWVAFFGVLPLCAAPTPLANFAPDTANYPGNFVAGDFYGSSLDINEDYVFVAAPGAHPATSQKVASGAIYVYKKEHGEWQFKQLITAGGTSDHFGGASVRSDGNWLFISSFGTPTGPNDPNSVFDQDFKGSIHIYKLDRDCDDDAWSLHQVIDSTNTPELADLSARIFNNPSDPTSTDQSGALFGSSLSIDAKAGWAIVGAQGQNAGSVKEAGAAYFFNYDKQEKKWVFVQKVTNPEGDFVLDNFGAAVELNDKWAFVSNGDLQSHAAGRLPNSKVWVFKRRKDHWEYTQTLTSSQPQELSNALGFFDAFGNSLSIDGKWAVVGSALDSTGGRAMGAAYVYKLQGNNWNLAQTIYSDEPFNPQKPGHLVGYLNSVRVNGDRLLVGDPGRSGPNGETHQGAVHAYKFKNGEWKKTDLIYAPNGQANDFFGVGVAIKDNKIFGGTLAALDLAYPVFMPPVDRTFVEIAPGVVVPVVAAGKANLFKD